MPSSITPGEVPVFLDESGRRWRRARHVALGVGVVTTLLVAILTVAVLIPPSVPHVHFGTTAGETPAKRLSAEARRRRQRLFAALRHHERPQHSVERQARHRIARPDTAVRPVTAGFFVNWDENSLASLRAHASHMDWVVGEWGFLDHGGDSLRLVPIKPGVLELVRALPDSERPRLFAMVSNFDSATQRFDARPLEHLLTSPTARARTIAQLADFAARYGMGGVTVDFEEVPAALDPLVLRFVRELRATMLPEGRLTTMAVSADAGDAALARAASASDRLFLMLYDEHYGTGTPGPVASQQWYAARAARMLRAIPPGKGIIALGAYGYDWNDGDPHDSGNKLTFQDVIAAAREHDVAIQFDSVALNPYLTWSDPDSTDHVVWFLDAVTAYNEMRAGYAAGAAGFAVWYLGSEDQAIWNVLGREAARGIPQDLVDIPPGYQVEFKGDGEILRIAARPTTGQRDITIDPATRLVTHEAVRVVPTPYVVERVGASGHRVALTFDDGPDAQWTPAILDTLRARHAPATFFVVGTNATAHLPLLRRMLAEGHEIGNHTWSHPDLARTGGWLTRLQIGADERLLEAATGRRSPFFRPPYFGDAEPTTSDELGPVSIATDMGFLTVGLHNDTEDWTHISAAEIVANALRNREAQGRSENVVLLHDGGGDRSETVAALGMLIDSLRARGDTLVPISALAGAAMDALPPRSAATRMAELAAFGAVSAVQQGVRWLLLIAIILGVGRLVVVGLLALVQRLRSSRSGRDRPEGGEKGAPPAVSVIIPAYNEAKVITRTIETLLAQRYSGELEIVVVDDGSPDDTYAVASAAYGDNPRVSIYRKANGGKASALNFGIRRARGEIVVCLDADTLFLPDTVARLIEPFADTRVGAVAGNAKVGNRVNLVTRWQAAEYITSQNLDRRAWSLLNCITVVPGAVGAWHKDIVQRVGGFRHDTLAEDQDLTITIRRAGYRIAYAETAIGYTEAPDTLPGLARQRFRWSFGTLQCAWKHRDALFRRREGSLGLVALPQTWLYQLLLTAISPLADVLFLWSLASVWITRIEHGAQYAAVGMEKVLILSAIFLFVDWLAAAAAMLIEPDEDRSLLWLIALQRFAYRQVMYWVVVKSLVAALRGRVVGWGKLERKATVEVPA